MSSLACQTQQDHQKALNMQKYTRKTPENDDLVEFLPS